MSFAESLGPEYSEMQILDLEATWAESEPRTPFVCLLSIGSDPTTQIGHLAKQKGISKFFNTLKEILLKLSLFST